MIIFRYLVKEVLSAFLAITFVLLFILLSNQFVRFLGYAASGRMAANVLFQSLGYQAILLLVILMPLGLYISIIVTYGRLYADNELRVMQAYGFGIPSLTQVTAVLSASIAIVVMILAVWVDPWIMTQKDKLSSEKMTMENIINTLVPGRFQATHQSDQVIYVEEASRDRHHVENVFIASATPPGDHLKQVWSVLSATRGVQIQDPVTKDRFMAAEEGYRYDGIPGENQYKMIQFKKYAIRLDEQPASSGSTHLDQSKISVSALWQERHNNPGSAAELQWRFSMPLSAFLLGILALPLSIVRPRQNRYIGLGPALLIYVIYLELLFVTRDWVQEKILPMSIGMWWVHGALIALIALCFFWQSHQLGVKKTTSPAVAL